MNGSAQQRSSVIAPALGAAVPCALRHAEHLSPLTAPVSKSTQGPRCIVRHGLTFLEARAVVQNVSNKTRPIQKPFFESLIVRVRRLPVRVAVVLHGRSAQDDGRKAAQRRVPAGYGLSGLYEDSTVIRTVLQTQKGVDMKKGRLCTGPVNPAYRDKFKTDVLKCEKEKKENSRPMLGGNREFEALNRGEVLVWLADGVTLHTSSKKKRVRRR